MKTISVPTAPFSWDALSRFRRTRMLDGYPANVRTFWSPNDDVHGALLEVIGSATQSLVVGMYGYDDDAFDEVIKAKMHDEHVFVQLSLDSSQAGGVHEREILAKWPINAYATSVAVGQSSKHAISHIKILIVDGVYMVRGSTNWSLAGEQRQNNECTITNDAVLAAEGRAFLDAIHTEMLAQMFAKAKAA